MCFPKRDELFYRWKKVNKTEKSLRIMLLPKYLRIKLYDVWYLLLNKMGLVIYEGKLAQS